MIELLYIYIVSVILSYLEIRRELKNEDYSGIWKDLFDKFLPVLSIIPLVNTFIVFSAIKRIIKDFILKLAIRKMGRKLHKIAKKRGDSELIDIASKMKQY